MVLASQFQNQAKEQLAAFATNEYMMNNYISDATNIAKPSSHMP